MTWYYNSKSKLYLRIRNAKRPNPHRPWIPRRWWFNKRIGIVPDGYHVAADGSLRRGAQ